MDLDGLDDFVNGDVPNLFEGKEETYTGLQNMLYVGEYVNNATDAETWADS